MMPGYHADRVSLFSESTVTFDQCPAGGAGSNDYFPYLIYFKEFSNAIEAQNTPVKCVKKIYRFL